MSELTFPIMAITSRRGVMRRDFESDFTIPLDLISPHEAQAQKNHDQTLQRLAERGGLSGLEALAVIEDRPYRPGEERHTNEEAEAILRGMAVQR